MSLIETFKSSAVPPVLIGKGSSRKVWKVPTIHGVVFKEAINQLKIGRNRFEAAYWDRHSRDPERASWLAPVLELSADGTILAMVETKKVPRDVAVMWCNFPRWFNDAHSANIGMIDDQIVIHDYGELMT